MKFLFAFLSLRHCFLSFRRSDSDETGVFSGQEWRGQVHRVIDGDTIWVDFGKGPLRVRLSHIDAPEHGQPFGTESQQWLERVFAADKAVVIRPHGYDVYGRVLGEVYKGDSWLNYWLVREGLAWGLPDDADKQIASAQLSAQQDRKGLWSANYPTPPWLFRKQSAVLN